MSDTPSTGTLAPLQVTCTSASCADDLHCFKFHSRKMKPADRGHCRYCGADLVDWGRVHARNTADVTHTFEALKREFIRHHFWHKLIDEKAELHARRKGCLNLRASAEKRIASSVGTAQPPRDGQQTPLSGNVLYYAQHATACCCRTCIEYWHGIPKGRPLTAAEMHYFVDLVMRFVGDRMPQLPDTPEKIPLRRRAN
jgi:hypothetical protein